MMRLRSLSGFTFVFALITFAQIVCTAGGVKAIYVPAPSLVAGVLLTQAANGTMWAPAAATLVHVLVAWTLAATLGTLIGAAIGRSAMARAYLGPALDFMRPLPASALVPAAILLFGSNANTVLIVTTFGSIWPVLLASVHGFQSVDARLTESARLLGLGAASTMWKVLLPSALTEIVAGARVSLAIALIIAVVTEMLTSVTGLGNNIVLAARAYNTPDLYAGIVMLGAIGVATNAVMEAAERRWAARIAGAALN